MKAELSNPLLHNPFHNRFKDPVTRRRDDMQSGAYTAWLRERNLEHSGFKIHVSEAKRSAQSGTGQTAGIVFTLLLVVVCSMVFLLKAF